VVRGVWSRVLGISDQGILHGRDLVGGLDAL